MLDSFLLVCIILSQVGIIYLLFQLLPTNKQQEVMRSFDPPSSTVLKWESPEEEEQEYHKKIIDNVTNREQV